MSTHIEKTKLYLRFLFLIGIYYYYFVSIFIVAPYNNWQYAKENGLSKWICFGEITATIDAFKWPYYIVIKAEDYIYYKSWSQKDIHNAQYFIQALEANQKAVKISNDWEPDRIDITEFAAIKHYMHIALEYSAKVRDDILDKIHPNLKFHFRTEFENGLKLHLSYLERETLNFSAELVGSHLNDQWIDWFNSHINEIRIVNPKNDRE